MSGSVFLGHTLRMAEGAKHAPQRSCTCEAHITCFGDFGGRPVRNSLGSIRCAWSTVPSTRPSGHATVKRTYTALVVCCPEGGATSSGAAWGTGVLIACERITHKGNCCYNRSDSCATCLQGILTVQKTGAFCTSPMQQT